MKNILDRFDLHLLTIHQVADNTRINYRYDLAQFTYYLKVNNIPIKSLTLAIIKDYLKHMSISLLKARSRARKINSLRIFLSYLHSHEGLGDYSKKLITPQYESPLPIPLTITEAADLLIACDKGWDKDKKMRKLLIFLLYATGMRITEAISLKRNSFIFSDNLVKVLGKGSKERYIPIPKKAREMIEEYIITLKSDWLFPSSHSDNPISRQTAWRIVKDIWAKTGNKKKITPHLIRHSYASHLLQKGANIRQIQMLLGHESLQSTQLYTQLTLPHIKEDYDALHVRS